MKKECAHKLLGGDDLGNFLQILAAGKKVLSNTGAGET
jgi:hypothetical protein